MKTKTQIKKDKKNYLAIALVVILLLLAVGYASFTQTLNITGNVAGNATWNVHFVDASCGIVNPTDDSVSGAALSIANAAGGNTTLTVNLTDTSSSGGADNRLKYPGDAKKIRATIKNDSSIPVKLTGFTVNAPTTGTAYATADSTTATNTSSDFWFDYVNLTTSEATPGAATSGEILDAGATCTYEFVIGWLTGSTATSIDGSYSITLNYMQSTNSSTLTSSHGGGTDTGIHHTVTP